MMIPVAVVLLLTVSYQTTLVQSRSYFRSMNSDEMDRGSSGEIKTSNKSFPTFLKNYPYGQARRGQGTYGVLGLGQSGRLFRIPDLEQTLSDIKPPRSKSIGKCGIVPQYISDFGSNFNDSFVSNGQIPWQAAVFTADGQFLCSGVLVSPKHVLTAAICLLTIEYESEPNSLQIRLGAFDLQGMVSSSEETNYHFSTTVSKVHLYPEMNITETSDASNEPKEANKTVTTSKIALLELKEKLNFTKHSNIRPICLERIPTPAATTSILQDRLPHDASSSSSEVFVNVFDKKQDGQQAKQRNKKEFESKKKTQPINGKKRLTSSKPLMKDRSEHDFLECYVAGWGSQNQPSITFLSKQLRNRDIEERDAIASLTLPVISKGKYVVHSDPDSASTKPQDEITSWIFKPATSSKVVTTTQEFSFNLPNDTDTSEYLSAVEELLTGPKPIRPVILPKLDPIEDYLDSVEQHSKKKDMSVNTATPTKGKSRKKQLKPELEYKEAFPNHFAKLEPIESDELLVDKQDTDGDQRRGINAYSRKLRLRWALVKMYNISNAENIDLGLGTSYVKPARSEDPDSLCMVDIGSPVVCRKRSSLIHPNAANMQKVLAGIVTWKMPCFSAREINEVEFAMTDLQTNYKLTQVTPINEILDFIAERVKESESETETVTSVTPGAADSNVA